MEGYVNLFVQDNTENNRPHYKGFMKIDGIDHEFALWPAKDGKKGFSGKYKPKEPVSNVTQADADKVWDDAKATMQSKAAVKIASNPAPNFDDEIGF